MDESKLLGAFLSPSNYIMLNRSVLEIFGIEKGTILCLMIDNYHDNKRKSINVEELEGLGISDRALSRALNELVREGYLIALKKKKIYQLSNELI